MASTQMNQQVGGVFVRWRPMRSEEMERGDGEVHRSSHINPKTNLAGIHITKNAPPKVNSNFNFGGRKRPNLQRRGGWSAEGFSGVLEQNDGNISVYEKSIRPFVSESILNGTTGCCFAYGMTGSGKTHTLLGSNDEIGMYLLSAQEIFGELEKIRNESDLDLMLNVRFVELYNKHLYDLLNEREECNLLEGPNGEVLLRNTMKDEDGLWISQGISGQFCKSWEEVEEAIQSGLQLRTSGNSTVHEHSSRSHAIIEMEIVSEELKNLRNLYAKTDAQLTKHVNDKGGFVLQRKLEQKLRNIKQQQEEALAVNPLIGGTLAFCDLAGAEIGSDVVCVGDEYISNGLANRQTEKERVEARQINMSLMALAEVLKNQINSHSRGSGARKHIGYRGSPLTLYLRKFLKGEDSKSLMMATVSPSEAFKKRTVQTLRYAKLLAENEVKQKRKKNKKRKVVGKRKKKVAISSNVNVVPDAPKIEENLIEKNVEVEPNAVN